MLSAYLICSAALACDQPASKVYEAQSALTLRVAYEKAMAQLGSTADDHVRLALWCEAHRMESLRRKHLTIALLKDPDHATARGLMGLVSFRDRWRSPEAVSEQVKTDSSEGLIRAEYVTRRSRIGNSADDHWKLALWCEHNGLSAESTAHLAAVTQLEPGRDAAWKRLGYRRQGGRWLTESQIAEEKSEADAQRKADKQWMSRLTRWRNDLEDVNAQAAATRSLDGVVDPRAVRSVWAVFGTGTAPLQKIAVQVLGQIDSTASTCGLASWRSAATREKCEHCHADATLRDQREAASFLVALLRDSWLDPDPILYHYMVKLVGSDALGSPGVLYVRGPYYDVLRFYTVDDSRGLLALGVPNTSPSPGYASAVQLQTRRQANDLVAVVDAIIRDSVGDVAAAQLHVRQIQQLNERIVVVLGAIVGKSLGTDRESARKWWTEERGYVYQAKRPFERQDWTLGEDKPTYTDSVHSSCFAADTPVLTLAGPMPIQMVKIGDQVLSQDPKTGAS